MHIYSVAYMREEVRFTHYYAMLSLFTASMLLLVVADNTLVLLVGWEGVGLCSFALIGHCWEEGANSAAALKAFLTTRTGDIGLMIGIIIMFFAAGTFNIAATNEYALSAGANHELLLAGAICLFIGIIGKSGQFPLHTWLPDAMAGPTPVSALIHAATMVVAGVYLGARLYPVFFEGFSIGAGGVNFMALIGGITIIIGAVLAFVQTRHQEGARVLHDQPDRLHGDGARRRRLDRGGVPPLHPRVLQGAALPRGGVGELLRVAPLVRHEERHGRAAKTMPITFWTFIIGSLALAGIFPFAGFWSKDEILVTAGRSGFDAFLVVGLVGAFLTAAYMTRCMYLTFFGEYRGPRPPARVGAAHHRPAHHPLGLLGVRGAHQRGAARDREVQGVGRAHAWRSPTSCTPTSTAQGDHLGGRSRCSASGSPRSSGSGTRSCGPLKGLTERNTLAQGRVHVPREQVLPRLPVRERHRRRHQGADRAGAYWFNQHVIDKIVNVDRARRAPLGVFTYNVVDQKVVDGAVNEIAEVTGETGGLLRYVQSGRVQRYALLLFAAVGLLSLALLLANI